MKPPDATRCIACDEKITSLAHTAEVTGPTTCIWRLCCKCVTAGARFDQGPRKTWYLIRRRSDGTLDYVRCWEQRNRNEEARRRAAKAVAA